MGASAAAVIIRKERELVDHFRAAGATTPDTARTPDELRVHTRFAWIILVKRTVIRPAPNGGYYLDEASWEATEQRRRRMLWIVVVAMIAVAIVTAIAGSAAWPHR